MKNNKKKESYNEDVDIDINACSATDCTGLIPSLPQNEAEKDSYRALYHFEADATDDEVL